MKDNCRKTYMYSYTSVIDWSDRSADKQSRGVKIRIIPANITDKTGEISDNDWQRLEDSL